MKDSKSWGRMLHVWFFGSSGRLAKGFSRFWYHPGMLVPALTSGFFNSCKFEKLTSCFCWVGPSLQSSPLNQMSYCHTGVVDARSGLGMVWIVSMHCIDLYRNYIYSIEHIGIMPFSSKTPCSAMHTLSWNTLGLLPAWTISKKRNEATMQQS